MHHCENVSIYLNVGSRPVVEGVKDVGFAPTPGDIASGEEEVTEGTQNLWCQVDDFNWLRREQSPHWKTIPVQDRIESYVWKKVISGDSGESGVDNVLKDVGLS
jgi:hypothetical protein